ncbi:unnamed protein product [Staurois parvus]|uniref:Peflin n=1 Tax=Staurois parvus TaxID=386267 RepID=A0ABN9EAG7_9NEOB|nr:unnamed protein product [Staurois parvus]
MALEDKLLGRLKVAIIMDNNMEEVALLASLHMAVLHQVHHMDLLKVVVVMDSPCRGVQHQGDQEVLMEAMLLGDLMVYRDPILMELLSKASMDKLLKENIPQGVNAEAFSWFQTVDTDRSGYITLKELKQALVNSNWSTFNDETCIMMLNMFDRGQSGKIDLFGFSALWTYIQQWKSLFQQYDRDRSGCISLQELHQALSQMGYSLSPQFTQQVMTRYAPRSANMTLQLDGFIQVCTKLQSMTEAFREKDTARSGSARLSYDDFLTMAVGRLL